MTDNTEKLEPCAHCGGEGVFGYVDDPESPDHGGHFLQCTEARCGSSVGLIYNNGEDPKPLLAERWNRRPTAPAPDAGWLDEVKAVLARHFEYGGGCVEGPDWSWDEDEARRVIDGAASEIFAALALVGGAHEARCPALLPIEDKK